MEPFAADVAVAGGLRPMITSHLAEERERQRTTGLPGRITTSWGSGTVWHFALFGRAGGYRVICSARNVRGSRGAVPAGGASSGFAEGSAPGLQELRGRIEALRTPLQLPPVGSLPWLEAAGIPWPESYEWEVIGASPTASLRHPRPEGGAAPARGADAPAEQPPQPLRQLPPAQQLRDLAPQRRQHDAWPMERRPRRSVHRRPPRDARTDVHASCSSWSCSTR